MSRGSLGQEQFVTLPSLSVAAHELKSPLALMRQLALLLDDDGISDDDKAGYRKQIITTADRALSLTSDLTQASNLQTSLFPLEPVNPFAVCRVISSEILPMQRLYSRHISWPKPRRNVLAVANSQLLSRVVVNFINNAIRYTDPSVPIVVSVRQSTSVIRLTVRDYGPQITAIEYRRLIDEMEQIKSVKTRPDSSGLGIYLASQFARAMQGDIGLTRHRDGIAFFIDMPVSRQMSLV